MRLATTLSISSTLFLLAACGVDTTGLSAESSRTPKGNPGSAIVVVEHADLQCPACRSAQDLIVKPLLAQYGQTVRFEFSHFPLGQHRFAMEAAQASECAADQGKFWEFVDIAYEKQADLKSSALRDWAAELKLDADLFDRCVRSGIKAGLIKAEIANAEKAGVNSTPTFSVNGNKIPQNRLDAVSAAIEAMVKQLNSVPL